MKNLTKILSLGVLLLLVTSCSKDNLAAKKLDGIWNITSFNVDNNELIIASLTSSEITFTERTANEGRYNTKVSSFGFLLNEVNGDYLISNNGSNISLKEDGSTPGTGTIVVLTKTNLHTTYTSANDEVVVIKAEKK